MEGQHGVTLKRWQNYSAEKICRRSFLNGSGVTLAEKKNEKVFVKINSHTIAEIVENIFTNFCLLCFGVTLRITVVNM